MTQRREVKIHSEFRKAVLQSDSVTSSNFLLLFIFSDVSRHAYKLWHDLNVVRMEGNMTIVAVGHITKC